MLESVIAQQRHWRKTEVKGRMQVAAGSEDSQAAMERFDQQSTNKPRLAAESLLHALAKEEIVAHQSAGEGAQRWRRAVRGGRSSSRYVSVLHCPI